MASEQTIGEVLTLLLDAPLANKPKPGIGQTDEGMLVSLVNVFRVTLADMDDELLKAATVQHIATNKWFPSIADLRAGAVSLISRTADTPDPHTAWGQVKSGRSLHPLAQQAIDSLGGMKAFGLSHVDDESSWRAQFIRAYENLQNREAHNAMTPPVVLAYIEKRKELGGASVSGLIGDVIKQLTRENTNGTKAGVK